LQVREAMAFTVPSFIGLFAGANAAHTLRSPYTSIPRGVFAAIATSTVLYAAIFILMGGVASRDALSNDFLLFEQVWLGTGA
jgi:amino acid transporter